MTLLVPLLFATRDGPYAMYARTSTYHLEAYGRDATGARREYGPTSLARHVPSSVAQFLVSADRDREIPQLDALRAHLPEIASLICTEHRDAVTAEIVLVERRGEDAAPSEERASVACR